MELITGKTEKIDCGLVFRSIGYFGVPVEDSIPYDHQKGIVPNDEGRVEPGKQTYYNPELASNSRSV